MSAYNPPIEDVPIFDSLLFSDNNDATLTISAADRRYLRYPIAQGTETIASLNTGGVLAITQNGTTGAKILNTQTGSAAQPATSGRTDFFNEDTLGAEVNSAMIDYSGFHTTTLNSLPDQVSSALSICPNSARAAAVNIANGANITAGCIVNIANGTGTNAGKVRIGKNNLINVDNETNSGNGTVNIGIQSGCQVRIAAGSNQTNTPIEIGSGDNQTGTIGIGSGGNSTRNVFISSGNGTTENTTHIGRGSAATGGIGALQIANTAGATEIKLFPSTVTGITSINNAASATGTVNIGNGSGTTTQEINIGRGNALSVTNGATASTVAITGGAVNIAGVPIKLNNTATGDIGIGFAGSGGSNIVDINNGASSTGAINIGNGSGTSAQLVRIGRNNALTLTNGSGTTQIDLIGGLRLNATGSVGNTFTLASQSNASGAIEIANGTNGLATVSICSGSTNNGVLNLGNCGSGSTGVINIGANGGTGLIQIGSGGRNMDIRGATISMFPTTFQVTGTNFSVGSGTTTLYNGGAITLGNSAQATSLLTIAQNTAGLVAGNLGFRTAASVAAANFTTASSNNYQNFATITAPAYQVSLINITALWDSKEAVASIRLGVAVSLTSGNNSTEAAAGLSFFQELDTQATAVIQSKQPLTGVYINTTASPVSLFVNAQFNQAWVTTAPQFSVTTSITKIG